jgi:hypothetical protein
MKGQDVTLRQEESRQASAGTGSTLSALPPEQSKTKTATNDLNEMVDVIEPATKSKPDQAKAKKRRRAVKTKKSVASKGVDGEVPEDDSNECENVEPDEAKQAVKPPKGRAKRGRPPKAKKEGNAKPDFKEASENPHSAKSVAATAGPRKRARKGTCALCTTCPYCQNKARDNENNSSLDITSFARSDAAVEKALIRRMQKLEKSTENLEEQTEKVKRTLKKHRRDAWKKKEKSLPEVQANRSRFLPDAEVFEAQQTKTRKLPTTVVHEAQKKMFPKNPGKFLSKSRNLPCSGHV